VQFNLSASNAIQESVFEAVVVTSVTGTTTFTATGWHHVAFVRTGNILKLFIDGLQEGSDPLAGPSTIPQMRSVSVALVSYPRWSGTDLSTSFG
jgi:hypothetical protein